MTGIFDRVSYDILAGKLVKCGLDDCTIRSGGSSADWGSKVRVLIGAQLNVMHDLGGVRALIQLAIHVLSGNCHSQVLQAQFPLLTTEHDKEGTSTNPVTGQDGR